ncbi:MAG: TIGR03960 family B12-binding radical SAM protein [Planctomycetaceae bacterium]|nr:TIGR03960 family B12-binding radical SAM protein [Planctomycetaceae bacterium]
MTFREQIESLLLSERINLPAQYIGGELGSIVKPKNEVKNRLCFAFPDVYTIGMSHYGLQLLYSIMNRRDDWACERAFTPYPDMEAALRKHQLPLYSLETLAPLKEFDVLGFTLQYELTYTNILTMLDLGGIPLHCADRTMDDPLVIAGGPSAVNPEPLADFIDVFVIGDGEETLPAVCDAWVELKTSFGTRSRKELIQKLTERFDFAATGVIPRRLTQLTRAAIVPDLSKFAPPVRRIVPLIECPQDRVAVEIMRGCPGRCKFCISTVQKRPLRYRQPDEIATFALDACTASGSREVSLLSLSTSDYPHFDELMEKLREVLNPLHVSISVPSLRVNHQLSSTVQKLTTERTSGLTLAPEAALDPMRKRIGKPITNENLLAGCETAFKNGFNRVKMYFLCGLPDETAEDIDGIVDLSLQIYKLGKNIRGKAPMVTANVSNFVPKPHTPWEREPMQTPEYFDSVHHQLLNRVRKTGISLKYHSLKTSLMEAVLCRGNRSIGSVIERAWQLGAKLDGWSEYFRHDLWQQALNEEQIDINRLIHTAIPDDEKLPWEYIRY